MREYAIASRIRHDAPLIASPQGLTIDDGVREDAPPTRRAAATANLEARLARSLVRRSTQGWMRASAFAIIALIWFALTAVGSYIGSNQVTVGGRLGDAIYNSLTFLSPRDGYGGIGHYPTLPPLLWWGRFFGVALSTLALLWAALYQSRRFLAGILIRSRASGHVVVLSSGGAADALARGSAEEGGCIVLVESGVSSDRVTELGRTGVIVMPLDTTSTNWLRDCRIDAAAHVVAWMENDSLSLSSAFAVRREMQSTAEIVVRLDSPEMQRSLRNAPGLLQSERGRLRPVSPTAAAVRGAHCGAGLVADAIARGQDRVHVALHGDGTALAVIATQILRHNWSVHLGAPRISWRSDRDHEAWRRWSQHNPDFARHAALAFGDDDPPTIGVPDAGVAIDDGSITLHVVDWGDDDRTMAAAFDLASAFAQREAHPPALQAVLRDAHAGRELMLHARTLAFAAPILIGAEASFAAFTDRARDTGAAHLHSAYAHLDHRDPAASAAWQALPEAFLEANRASADHVSIKRHDRLHADASSDRTEGLEALARMEHRRWMAERLLDGWAPSSERNNDRRLHDKLVPWERLSEGDRDKDRLAIREAFANAATDARA